MHPELNEIKRLRKKHNLTQSELAKLSSVSQSLVAKIESGKIDPAYTSVRKIQDVLSSISEEKEQKAEEIMIKRIVSCTGSEQLPAAIKKMKSNGISQLPVIERNIAIGLVTESIFLEQIVQGKPFASLKVRDIMQEAPPIVSKKTPVRIVIDLLRFSPLVIIADNGVFEGVVTKTDVLKLRQL
jgi:predicted transcriptional regulator